MNRAIFSGNLGKDPEMRRVQNGTPMARFSLAVRRNYRRDGQPETDWFNCICFGRTAEFSEKYLHKGAKVIVEGEVQNSDWTDRDGNRRRDTHVLVGHIELSGPRREHERDGQPDPRPMPAGDSFMNVDDGAEDGIPFA